jgi:L-rhamnose mutarotase
MKRFGQIIKIKQEGLEIYKRYRKNLWPEVNQKLKTCNIRNYYIYQKDNYLFAYFEYSGEDFEKDMKELAAQEEDQGLKENYEVVARCCRNIVTAAPSTFMEAVQWIFFR